jgi:[citrate (pro-3S)-lyase] ligase
MEMIFGTPADRRVSIEAAELLAAADLQFDADSDVTINLIDNGRGIATGSRKGKVLKCIAVDSARRSEGLLNRVVSALVSDAAHMGLTHLFLFTKPGNKIVFQGVGFYPIASTEQVLLMENSRGGIDRFVKSLDAPNTKGHIGCIVAHCNPFTKGHLFLAEIASRSCDLVHFFVLSESGSMFTSDERLQLAKTVLRRFPNILVHPTGDYLVSYITFPDYFLKRNAKEANCLLDLTVFIEKIAGPLGINERFIGTEPVVPIMSQYNTAMLKLLPSHGIRVTEVPRLKEGENVVSASEVRRLMANGELEKAMQYLPPEAYSLICKGHPEAVECRTTNQQYETRGL